jgi:hypothetical protein
MNALERVRAVMHGGVPDRPPVFDLLRNDAAIQHYAAEELVMENKDRVVYKAIGRALDSTKQFIRLPEVPRNVELSAGRTRTYARWTYWTQPLPFRDVGEAAQHLKHILLNPEEFIGDVEDYVRRAEQDYLHKKAAIGDISLFLEIDTTEGFHDFYESMGIERLSYLIVDYPELIGEYLGLVVERSLRRIDALTIADMLPGVFYGVDLAYRTGPLFAPKFLRKQVFPHMERVIHAYKSKGIPVMYHSDGNLWSILDDLVALGIDALNPIETMAGMDLAELRKRYPDLVLVGGIDCSQLLPFATAREVSDAVLQALRVAGPKYIVGSSTELHNAIPLENIRAMIDTARQYRY